VHIVILKLSFGLNGHGVGYPVHLSCIAWITLQHRGIGKPTLLLPNRAVQISTQLKAYFIALQQIYQANFQLSIGQAAFLWSVCRLTSGNQNGGNPDWYPEISH